MPRSIETSLKQYARGIAGGFLFSLPLIYTMEIWWIGFVAGTTRLIIGIAATYLLLLGYNNFAGLRRDRSFGHVATESIEDLGLGLLMSLGLLWLVGEIRSGMSLSEIVGKSVIEAMTIAIGISIGTAQLGGSSDQGRTGQSEDDVSTRAKRRVHLPEQLVMAACGAVVVASNIAPTQEVVVIAANADTIRILGMVALSLAIGATILYYSEFNGASRHVREAGSVPEVVAGVTVMYAMAVFVSAFLLWFYGRFDHTSLTMAVAESVALGLPATLGSSAGRLLLQQQRQD